MNAQFRDLLIAEIKKALADSSSAIHKNHRYLEGKVREILLERLVTPLLNKRFSTGTGHVVDYKGAKSRETDICIYSNNLLSPLFHSASERFGIFPIESVLCCIEVKTTLSKRTLKDAYEKFKHLNDHLVMSAGQHGLNEDPLTHYFIKPQFDFFAFGSTSKKYTPEYILSIYKEIDDSWEENPLITSICVANKGWVCNSSRGWYHMSYDKKNKVNEEIIGYLCTLVQGLSNREISRGVPRIGYYLSDTFQMDKIVNGKKVRNTWKGKKIGFSNTELQ